MQKHEASFHSEDVRITYLS